MVSLDAAARLALALPEVTEGTRWGRRTWFVGGKAFAWVRPLSKADLKRFGDERPPAGDILAISVADLSDKEAALAANPATFFTIEHFTDYPAILVRLAAVSLAVLREALLDGWLSAAPAALIQQHFPS